LAYSERQDGLRTHCSVSGHVSAGRWVREGWEVPLPPLSVGCRAGQDR